MSTQTEILIKMKVLLLELKQFPKEERINALNRLQYFIQKTGPFNDEPISKVIWIPLEKLQANDYNPNKVAPPEMELLYHSISEDGYTQPIVVFKNPDTGLYETVDGFHRSRVAREYPAINEKLGGYVPVTVINKKNEDRNNRIASTIRHNRARGKHTIEGMMDIVVELKKRNWTTKKIGKELGMDDDEVLRLCQISGLTELFNDDFSKSWDIDIMTEEEIDIILDEDNIEQDKAPKPGRILHTYEKWECFHAGFYAEKAPNGISDDACVEKYVELLSDIPLFKKNLKEIITKWVKSCEHYLTNDSMNRIAWLGQAALCNQYGIPSKYRIGYNHLTEDQKYQADKTALKFLNIWLRRNGYDTVPEETIKKPPQADLY